MSLRTRLGPFCSLPLRFARGRGRLGMRRTLETFATNGGPNAGTTLKVLTWNVLADGLAQGGEFLNCKQEHLEWAYRLPRVLGELVQSDADLIALQECNHFSDIAAALPGHCGLFVPKVNSPCLKYGAPGDGLAVFYRKSRFEPVSDAIAGPYQGHNQVRYLQRLREVTSGAELIFSTTHLKAKGGDDNDAARCNQAQQLVASLASMDSPGRPVAVILTGDFNCEPGSAAVRAVADHGLGDSAAAAPESAGEDGARFTTWKFRPAGEKSSVIDYIFFRGLGLVGRWAQPLKEAIGPGALPSADYPSDHLAMFAEFRWRDLGAGPIALGSTSDRSIAPPGATTST